MKESDWTNSLPLDKIITHSKRCEDYLQGETMGESINIDLQKKVSLTRQELHELETKEKTGKERLIEKLILVLPEICAVTAILEYMLIPDNSMNRNPYTYLGFLILMMVLYNGYGIAAAILHCKGDKRLYEKFRYRAPLWSALFLLFAGYDYLTLKTGVLTQPFVPCMNFILNAAWTDRAMILDCTIHTLGLLFLGYFAGVSLGRSGDQIFRSDPYVYLDPDHDGHSIFFIWRSGIYHCPWLLVCGNRCVYDRDRKCRQRLF